MALLLLALLALAPAMLLLSSVASGWRQQQRAKLEQQFRLSQPK
jgi:hypothetical protein